MTYLLNIAIVVGQIQIYIRPQWKQTTPALFALIRTNCYFLKKKKDLITAQP